VKVFPKPRAFFVFLSLLFLGSCATDEGVDYQPALWKFSSARNTVYLLGSIHLGSTNMYPMAAPIENAFAASPVLLVETYQAPSVRADDPVLREFRNEMFYPGHDSLWNHVNNKTHRRLLAYWKRHRLSDEFEMDADKLAQFRPWVVALLLDLGPTLAEGLDPDLGVDNHFIEEAERAGKSKQIVGIETEEFQARLLSGFSEDLQVKWLQAEMGMSEKGLEPLMNALVDKRNVQMADAAEKYLKGNKQVFMVVGAKHLEGDDGIVQLMKNRGHQVEQVYPPRSP
jgi:uncharacterized protein